MPDNSTETVIENVDNNTEKTVETGNTETSKSVPLSTFLKLKDDYKSVKEKVDELLNDKQKQEQDKKIAEGKKDEVIIDLTKQLEENKKKAGEWEKYSSVKREKLKKDIGENWLESFNLIPLDELEVLASKFSGKSLVDSDTGSGKTKQPGKLEGLLKDLELAKTRKDLPAQIAINRLIDEERKRK